MRWIGSLLLLGLLAGCGRTAFTNFPPTTGQAWVAFGDSLTYGTGAANGEDYPSRLGRELGIEVLNAGAPGATSADGLTQLEKILELDPKVVLLCLGGNDGLQKVPLTETLANLSAIIARLQEHGAFVVLIGVRSASLLDGYDKPLRQLAREKNTLFIRNILDGVLGKRSLMSDQIHPNAAGYQKIAARLAAELRKAGVDKL
jgi:lysophospholipase L1-like esterase